MSTWNRVAALLSLCFMSAPALAQERQAYGPGATNRGTLLQWSYGTSFSGGPPGRDERLVSDRPDFTEASTTVGARVAQLEMGYTFVSDAEGGDSTEVHSTPEMLWRIGVLADWFEFRIAYNHLISTSTSGGATTRANGSDDLYLGAKIALTPQEGVLPEMAIIPQARVPTGLAAVTFGQTLPGVNWLYGWDINDRFSTAGSTQINRLKDEDTGRVYYEIAQSWTVGCSLTDRLGAYTESFALLPSGADSAKPEYYADGGFTFSVNNDLQFDVRAGLGLNAAASDYFVGTGLVKRF